MTNQNKNSSVESEKDDVKLPFGKEQSLNRVSRGSNITSVNEGGFKSQSSSENPTLERITEKEFQEAKEESDRINAKIIKDNRTVKGFCVEHDQKNIYCPECFDSTYQETLAEVKEIVEREINFVEWYRKDHKANSHSFHKKESSKCYTCGIWYGLKMKNERLLKEISDLGTKEAKK